MNTAAALFLLANATSLLLVPRRWAAFVFLLGACYTPFGSAVEISSISFTGLRFLIAIGLLRALIRRETISGPINSLDRTILIWGIWIILNSVFHNNIPATIVHRLGLVYNLCGAYFIFRVLCCSIEDVRVLLRMTAILVTLLAAEMLFSEQRGGRNLFALFGGVQELPTVRNGMIRAQGPFGNAILAGTFGASTLPLMIAIFKSHRTTSIIGTLACLSVVYTSASSGPILTALAGLSALLLWPWRRKMKGIRRLILMMFVFLVFAMEAPVYYVLARFDLTGSSTGWHRAEVIDAARRHFSEWWLFGTDYTRHWMPYGIQWTSEHIDITNYYIQMGVYAGLFSTVIFVLIFIKAFAMIGKGVTDQGYIPDGADFLLWGMGASLFSHSITLISVSYFDQSTVFLFMLLAGISAFSQNSNSRIVGTPPDLRRSLTFSRRTWTGYN